MSKNWEKIIAIDVVNCQEEMQESADQKRIYTCGRSAENILEKRGAKYMKKLMKKCDT